MKLTIKLWILIISLLLSILAISPWQALDTGVEVQSIDQNSSLFQNGLKRGMVIKQINGKSIESIDDYTRVISEIDFSSNFTKLTINTEKEEIISFVEEQPQLVVDELSLTDIETGLELSGGSRALVKPANASLTSQQMNDLIAVTQQRFNVYGISDVTIRPVQDLEGNNFMMVEIAGATPEDLENLVSEQGKFDAKIGNKTVFTGGDDIASVCRNDATCARVESPSRYEGSYVSNFRFAVYLSEEAAQRHANVTKDLDVNVSGRYLEKKLDLFLDDKKVSSLAISADLKGRATTQISISGSGTGDTQEQAYENARNEMNRLQTVLITGSLPYKLEIVKLDTISPKLGQEFINYLLLAGVASLIAVAIIVLFRYKTFKSSIALLFTSTSEIVIILGVAALIGWNLDLASIAGILTVIGTGVDQQIILIDESRSKEKTGIVAKIKRALFIIIGAYFTSLAALIPIYWVGAGLLRGFAVTTIIGITAGVLITRPAFADLLKIIEE